MTENILSETVWMPLQTIYNKELLVGEYLREKHIEYYIPMSYELHEAHGDPEQGRRTLVPAIHNLLFIRCRYPPVQRGMVPPLCARIAPPRLLPEARTGGKRVLHRGRGGDAELHPCHQPRH